MRLDINLATRPYEDARQFWSRWGTAIGVVALVTLVLLGLVVRGWVNARRDRQAIAQLEKQISERDHERASAQAFLELAANRSTRDQSQFLNGLIRQKAFSWTHVFEELERVMPNDLHAVSLKPEMNEQNQLELEMTVACQNRAAAIELVHRMEGSKHFQGSRLDKESQGDNPAAGVSATVSAVYVPDPPEKAGK